MTPEKFEVAQRVRDLRVAEALGLDPAFTFDVEVDIEAGEVWWRHAGPEDTWPEYQGLTLAQGEFPRLGRDRYGIHPEAWAKMEEAQAEWEDLFPKMAWVPVAPA